MDTNKTIESMRKEINDFLNKEFITNKIKSDTYLSMLKYDILETRVNDELRIFENTTCFGSSENNLKSLYEIWKNNPIYIGTQNKINSWAAWLLGITQKKPEDNLIFKSTEIYPNDCLNFVNKGCQGIYEEAFYSYKNVPSKGLDCQISRFMNVFKEEIEKINPFFVLILQKCFHKYAKDCFWTCSDPFSAGLCPENSSEGGGLVRNVKMAFWWALELFRIYDIKYYSYEGQVVLTSILLSDIQFGNNHERVGTNIPESSQFHGLILASQILDMDITNILDQNGNETLIKDNYSGSAYCVDNVIEDISVCVALHMGKWTDKTGRKGWDDVANRCDHRTKMVGIVFLACYTSSRMAKYMSSQKNDNILDKLKKYN